MIISVKNAVLHIETVLPKFDVESSTVRDQKNQELLLVEIKVKPGTLNSRGQELKDGSYTTREEIRLYPGGVEDFEVDAAVENMKTYLRTHDTSGGWTNLF